MKVAIAGLWHLGSVTAACLARAGHDVVGYDPNPRVATLLAGGGLPVAEPGLGELVASELNAGRLRFTSDPSQVGLADVLWICFDTPVDGEDRADFEFVITETTRLFPFLADDALVAVSSQLPAGSISVLLREFKRVNPSGRARFACIPENLRLGRAIETFVNADRFVVGTNSQAAWETIGELLAPLGPNLVRTSLASAEMVKHALNAFLAMSVTFINEIASLCECRGADAFEVERALKSDKRIGPGAYLRPGPAFAGGTLARDVRYLAELSASCQMPDSLFSSIRASNSRHAQWPKRKLQSVLGDLRGKRITVLGLTYKPGTDTLRRSLSVELCRWLSDSGALVTAHDPAISSLPAELAYIGLAATAAEALEQADAVVIATSCKEFAGIACDTVLESTTHPVVLDPGLVAAHLGEDDRIQYFTVGRGDETSR